MLNLIAVIIKINQTVTCDTENSLQIPLRQPISKETEIF